MAEVKGRLAASVPDAPPLSRRHLRFLHPGKLTPGCKAQRRFAPVLFVVAAGSCSFLAWFFHPF
ncbi:putative ydaA protein (plasmid) [Klebsiella michiganensis]|nr:putative ydaA protein [Klebsiella michiganensis]